MPFQTVIPEAVANRLAISMVVSIFKYAERKCQPTTGGNKDRYTVRSSRLAEANEQFIQEVLDYGR